MNPLRFSWSAATMLSPARRTTQPGRRAAAGRSGSQQHPIVLRDESGTEPGAALDDAVECRAFIGKGAHDGFVRRVVAHEAEARLGNAARRGLDPRHHADPVAMAAPA